MEWKQNYFSSRSEVNILFQFLPQKTNPKLFRFIFYIFSLNFIVKNSNIKLLLRHKGNEKLLFLYLLFLGTDSHEIYICHTLQYILFYLFFPNKKGRMKNFPTFTYKRIFLWYFKYYFTCLIRYFTFESRVSWKSEADKAFHTQHRFSHKNRILHLITINKLCRSILICMLVHIYLK